MLTIKVWVDGFGEDVFEIVGSRLCRGDNAHLHWYKDDNYGNIYNGKVWIMNDNGKTIADYDLDLLNTPNREPAD